MNKSDAHPRLKSFCDPEVDHAQPYGDDPRTSYAATPAGDLRNQIMNSNVPKNEREHWAAREIDRLTRVNSQLIKAGDAFAEYLRQLPSDNPSERYLLANWDDSKI